MKISHEFKKQLEQDLRQDFRKQIGRRTSVWVLRSALATAGVAALLFFALTPLFNATPTTAEEQEALQEILVAFDEHDDFDIYLDLIINES